MNSIADNFARVNACIAETCLRANRKTDSVKLVVVTKRQPVAKIQQVIAAGATCLGENYPEETVKKILELDNPANIEWHMIGHIQSRKIKFLVDHFSFVHSIDRFEIAQKLNNACVENQKLMPVFIEVNVSGEETKFGFDAQKREDWTKVSDEIRKIHELSNLEPVGLMVMPPLATTQGSNRAYFEKSKNLLDYLNIQQNIKGFNGLSMGTSSDFEEAIKAGATVIRIGEEIMGTRNYA